MQNVSPTVGVALARRLWRLVLAVWLVPVALAVPAVMIYQRAVGSSLARLPADTGGDAALVLFDGLRKAGPGLGLAIVAALLLHWLWTVVWHAGVTGWLVWSAGRPVRLGEIVGLGLLRFWRYMRLALTAAAGTAVLLAVVCGPLVVLSGAARRQLAEVRMLNLRIAAIVFGGLLLWLCWTATLRGAWLLADPGRRSAALAWASGLADAVRDPLRSLGTVLLWGGLGKLFLLAPLVLGFLFDGLAGTTAGLLLGHLCALLAAGCWVILFLSFAPVSGLLLMDEEDEETTAGRGSQGS